MSLAKCCKLIDCFVLTIFFSLNSDLSQQGIDPHCTVLSIFNLSTVVDCRWAEDFDSCLEMSPLAMNRGGGALPTFVLQNISCAQYSLTEDFSCSCQMDCLLSFDRRNNQGSGYAFFRAISCDASQLDEVKDFFGQADTNITFINGPIPFTSCNMTGQLVF